MRTKGRGSVKKGGKIAFGIFIGLVLVVAAAGIVSTVYLDSLQKRLKIDVSQAEAATRKAETEREMLKIELDDAQEKLKERQAAASGPVGRHPETGMSPIEIVKLTLTLKGEDLEKFAYHEKSNNGSKAEVWIGPLNSQFNKAYDFARQDDEWILTDIRKIGS